MAEDALLSTSTTDLSRIFTNGLAYQVPSFQRDYAWDEDNWEDLWTDLMELYPRGGSHYMGALVLKQESSRRFTIIDGQQRLATLSVLILAALKRLGLLIADGIEARENEERINLLRAQFIGAKDPSSLTYSSKLSLNAVDDGFYQTTLVQLQQPISVRRLRTSERLLWNAFEYFDRRLGSLFSQGGGAQIAQFVNEVVGRQLTFIQIVVQDDLSAYTVFETLNARGLEQSAPDLVKNYLFSKLSPAQTDLVIAQHTWSRICDRIPATELTEFIRHYLNSRQRPYVRKERLFKVVRESIVKDRNEVFPFLRELEDASFVYDALRDPNDEFWLDYPGAAEHVRALTLFRVTQYKPLILASVRRLENRDTISLLRACVAISFRFNVIGRRGTHQLEDIYNQAAAAIEERKCRTVNEVLAYLRPIYIEDTEFQSDFQSASVSSSSKSRIAKYILCQLERQISNSEVPVPYESPQITVEHILPEGADSPWGEFRQEQVDRYVHRLGNLALLEATLNREASTRSFSEKAEIYSRSQFETTRSIRGVEWSPSDIDTRQRQMARIATAIWNLQFA